MTRQTSKLAAALLCATLLGDARTAVAFDRFEPFDNNATTAPSLLPFGGPQAHDLESVNGAADVDWFLVHPRPMRSYEIRLSSPSTYATVAALGRYDVSDALVQSGGVIQGLYSSRTTPTFLRWQVGNVAGDAALRTSVAVTGQVNATASAQYEIELLDTTLFCARYNNSASQASLLFLQAAPEAQNSCSYTVWFHAANGAIAGPANGTTGTLNETNMTVLNTSALAGLAGTSGSARVTHTCGYRNIVAKLVSIEPATGFAFDTPCSPK